MFQQVFEKYNWEDISDLINSKASRDVEYALQKKTLTMNDFAALLSPAASAYLESLAIKSHELTLKRFGNTIQMYIPMYLSNECQNICTYCGFSLDNKIKRTTLTDGQILNEVEVIKSLGYDHILLVTGEANKTVGIDYLLHAIRLIKPYFSNISIEVQPLDEEDYQKLTRDTYYIS